MLRWHSHIAAVAPAVVLLACRAVVCLQCLEMQPIRCHWTPPKTHPRMHLLPSHAMPSHPHLSSPSSIRRPCLCLPRPALCPAAKNVILAGVKSITLHDRAEVALRDLGAQFYLTEGDVGRNRAEACRWGCGRRVGSEGGTVDCSSAVLGSES